MSAARWTQVKARISELITQYRQLQSDNAALTEDVSALKSDNVALAEEVSTLQSDNAALGEEVSTLQSDNASLGEEVNTLQSHVAALMLKIENQKSQTVNTQEWTLMQTQMARKDMMLQSLELEKERALGRIQELEETLLLKDSTLQVQKNTINELTEQNKLIKLAKEMSTEKGDTHELKIKINELIRDIDRCIDLLND